MAGSVITVLLIGSIAHVVVVSPLFLPSIPHPHHPKIDSNMLAAWGSAVAVTASWATVFSTMAWLLASELPVRVRLRMRACAVLNVLTLLGAVGWWMAEL